MMVLDKGALICDLAETYGVLDYKALPVELLATLSVGLRDNSRIKMKCAEISASPLELMIAHIADNLSLLRWGFTEAGQKGKSPPALFTKILSADQKHAASSGYATGAEFEAAWARL